MDSPSSSGYANKQVLSTPSSPVLSHSKLAYASNSSHPRHMSDASARPVGFGPRSEAIRDLTSEYQFSDIITANTGQAMPKRVSMGNKKSAPPSSSMAHLVRGNDPSRIPLPGDIGRNTNAAPALRLGSKSRSPHNRLAMRSSSPAPHLLSGGRHLSPAARAVVQETYGVDMNNAYRRLSDANLLRSGGALAEIGRRKKSDDQAGGGRLTKDYLSPDGDELLEDSSDDGYSSQEEGERGRKAARNFEGLTPDSDKGGPKTNAARKALSLLAAAEEERKSNMSFPFFYLRNKHHKHILLPSLKDLSPQISLVIEIHHLNPQYFVIEKTTTHSITFLYPKKNPHPSPLETCTMPSSSQNHITISALSSESFFFLNTVFMRIPNFSLDEEAPYTRSTPAASHSIAFPYKRAGHSMAKDVHSDKHDTGIEVSKTNPDTKYQYRSLLDEPEINITGPQGERPKQSRQSDIHPATSFDDGPPSGTRTPVTSDTEADLTDIRRAQKLSFSQTAIRDTPNAARALRIIYRGDWRKVVQDAKDEQRPLRKYIVATDLSDESTHALEWAVGTVLRDGDTMICISCVDEDAGVTPGGSAQVPDDPKAMKEQGAALSVVANNKAPVTPGGSMLEVQKAGQGSDLALGPAKSKAAEDRHRAVQDITEKVTKLLRKTRLQVRVIVEVLHCKNPKHQILEIIDVVSPTLVVVGSRGQSALKG